MKNIKIGTKLIASYLAITIIAICACVYLLLKMSQINDGTTQLYEKAVQPLENMATVAREVQMLRITIYQAILSESKEELRKIARTNDSLRAEVTKIYDIETKRLIKQKNKDIMAGAKKALEDYGNAYPKFITSLENGAERKIPRDLYEIANKLAQYNRELVLSKGEVSEEINSNSDKTYNFAMQMSIAVLSVMIILSIIIGLYMTFSITKPLGNVVEVMKKGEEGDMRARSGINQEDEIGKVARAVDNFFEKIQRILRTLHENSDSLAGASEELSSVSRMLAAGSEETVNQSNNVASTAEEMAVNINAMASSAEEASVNANEVAGAAEELSTNMNTIASAVEEMSASINQIAGNTGEVRKVATDATTKASAATNAMSKLGAAAKEIGQVTDVIKKIADKTNLLALNATIEAASAGEAGKGFAVVAGEIKELANQSAQSADDIAHRIEGIQTGTNDAVKVIHDVSDIIEKINVSVVAIAGHVDQQTKASNEIASNVAQANTGTKRIAGAIGEVAKGSNDASRNAGEAAKGANNVSSNTVGMSKVAKESAQGASQVSVAAADLSRVAGELKQVVDQFKV